MAIIPADEKVFMVDKRTNTTYGGSQALQDMQQWYTMQDVADSVLPYKVFTALLTQSGGENVQSKKSGDLTIGVTYSITGFGPLYGADFTNVGAPDNNSGTYFIATGTTPNSWGNNLGGDPILLYSTGAPVANVLENTIGNIWFTYNGVGFFSCNSNGLFTTNKTCPDFKNVFGGQWHINLFEDMEESNPNQLFLVNYNYDTQALYDGIDLARIEIRVYN